MELCRKSVVRLCSAVCSCCKRPSTPQLPDEIPTAAPGECADVPTITPQKLPEITEVEQLNRFILYIEGLLAALEEGLTSKLPEEARRIVTNSLKGLGSLHWVGVAFSIVAFVLENLQQVSSNMEECINLLEKIVDLAKILQQLSQRMSGDQTDERLKKAVHTIVEGAVVCCSYMQGRTLFRQLTAQTVGQRKSRLRDGLKD